MNISQTVFRRVFTFIQLYLITLLFILPGYAAGEVDPTFNVNVENISNEIAYALALQPDGKVLVGGSFNSAN